MSPHSNSGPPPHLERLFPGDSELAGLMRTLDWSRTGFGPVTSWAQSLHTALRICLTSRFPMVMWWGPDLLLLYNDAWRPVLGHTKHPAVARPGREVWPEIWHIIGPMLEGVLSTGQATWQDDQLLMLDRNGYLEEAYFTYSYSPIFLEDGRVGGAFSAVSETTGRVLGERRLCTLRDLGAQASLAHTTEDASRMAMSTLNDNQIDVPFALLYLLSADGKYLVRNATAPLKTPPPAAPETVDVMEEPGITDPWGLVDVLRTGKPAVRENLHQRIKALPSGPWPVPVDKAMLLPLDAPGQDRRAGVLIIGINPCRALDADYESFLHLLAGHIGTAVANAHAYEEEKRRVAALAELDRAKTAFFSNVSHEFRTPLTLMLGPLEDLLAHTPGQIAAEHRELLTLVHRNGLRLQKLVNTLLDFSRIEAGRVQAVYEPTDLAAFTAELASNFRSACERAGLRLMVDCPPLPTPVYVDRDMWEKIVLNLLSNAFKFTFEGEIAVTLRAAGEEVKLTVRDTGTGIPAEELPHLFERFHRVEDARGRTHEGTGIGLALVQELLKLHGGSIQVESVLGGGSTFTVSLPIGTTHLPSHRIGGGRTLASTALGAEAYVEEALRWLPDQAPLSLNATESPLAIETPAQIGTRPRIVLADDNADMRDYVQRLLSTRYQVEAVTDGQAALEAVRRQLPDLVLSDVMMPRMDGFALVHALRQDPTTAAVPVILLSARAGEESQVEGLEAGADDYLTKPFSAAELLARVGTHLELARMRSAATEREREARLEAEAVQAQLKNILESITDGFVVVDRDWRFQYVNPQGAKLMGRAASELLGGTIWEKFPHVVGGLVEQKLRQSMHEQKPLHFEIYDEIYQSWFENDFYPSSGGLSIFFRDITPRKRAEQKIRDTEEQLRMITDNAPVYIAHCDRDSRYLFVNQRYAERLGLTREQVIGKRIPEVVGPEAYESFRHYVEAALAGQRVNFEIEVPYQAVGRRYMWCAYVPHMEDDGTVQGLVAVISDITERKQMEEKILQLNVVLEQKVAERTGQLTETIKELEAFSYSVSHDLRTPLRSIDGFSRIIMDDYADKFDDKGKEYFQRVRLASQRMAELIDALLDFSRLSRADIVRKEVRLSELAQLVCSELEKTQPERRVRLSIQSDIKVIGDAKLLRIVPENLIGNAWKFTAQQPRADIQFGSATQDGRLVFFVKDNGAGFDMTYRNKLFGVFQRLHSTKEFPGTGIGLATVQRIIHRHGGQVWAEGKVGKGAAFYFTLGDTSPKVRP